MAIKVNLPTIPILDAVSLSDQVLIGSSVAHGGVARLTSLLAIQSVIGGGGGGGATINADDGYQYVLVGVAVDGEIAIQAVRTVVGSTASPAIINVNDGHQYRLQGVVVDGEITIQTVLVS